MESLDTIRSLTVRPAARGFGNTAMRRIALVACLVLGLCFSLWPLHSAHASGVFWLPTRQASDPSFDHLNPVLGAYHNHAYILSVRVNGSSEVTTVFFSTNEAGTWKTQLISDRGPVNTYSREFTSLAVDASTGRLYAAWVYQKSANTDALGVWTRSSTGQWTGPTDVATAGALIGQPFIVAGNGKAYAAFISSDFSGACDDSATRTGDVQVVSYDGATWSAPQNLSSCVSDTSIQTFATPKLALDENGRAYLVSSANGDLWYADNTTGSWSDLLQVTHSASVPDSVGTALRTFYGIAASNGTVYVTYLRHLDTPRDDVLLTLQAGGGSWKAPVQISPQDPQDCPKFGLSIVANAGRVGVSYVRAHTGYCHVSSGVSGNVPFLFVGAPGQMAAVASLEGANPDCFATSLANEGNLFRFVAACDQAASIGKGQLSYKAELLDTVGPVAQLHAPGHASSSIQLHWSAKDPQPGSGVASYQLQVRADGGAWKTLLGSTAARTLTYRGARSGHRYTFRLRARDRVDNWGAWVSASTQVSH
jgi:Fibronectin type III domain